MKKSSIGWVIAAMVFMAGFFPIPAFAGLDDTATTDLLCSCQWVFYGKGWHVTFTFNRDHTAIGSGEPNERLTWQIVDDKIRLIQHAKYLDIISIPLNPSGTQAHATKGKGYDFTVAKVQPKPQGGDSQPGTAGGSGSTNPPAGGGGDGNSKPFGTTNPNGGL